MMKSLLVLTLCFTCGLSLSAQNDIYQVHDIGSESLGSTQRVLVHLPPGYQKAGKEYPVLYILDAQWYFLNGVAIQETLRDELLPEMITVGVDLKNRKYRDSLLNEKWNEFITFMEDELPGFVGEKFPVSGERIVFGWESNGFVASELVLTESPAFGGAIVSNGGYLSDEMIASFKKYSGGDGKKYLFLANTEKDIYSIDYSKRMNEKLEENDFEHLIWKYQLFNDEIHESLSYLSLYHGLKYYYHNYPSMVYSGIEEFREKGGLPYLKEYFRQRSERFGTNPEIDNSTKNSLIWLAWNRDNFEAFSLFMTEFADVLTTRRYASAYWQNRLAQYYLKYEDYSHAIEYFSRGINEYPDGRYMTAMHAGLGKAYQGNNEKRAARENFRKAVSFAKANSDPKLAEYEALLKSGN